MIEANALAQGALRQFPQWPWIENPTFQLGGGHFTTELFPPQTQLYCNVICKTSEHIGQIKSHL